MPHNANSNESNNRRAFISDEDRERIVSKTLEGYSVSSISNMLSIKYQTVNSIVKRYLSSGLVSKSKMGGDKRSKLTKDMKNSIIEQVNQNASLTLNQIKSFVEDRFGLTVSKSTIDRCLDEFHFSMKRITPVPERRNCATTIDLRKQYSRIFRNLEVEFEDRNLIFLDEVGF